MSKRKTTQKQIDAARRNGKKSSGPVSPEGKERSARNAITHGLHSKSVVLPSEDDSEFDRLLESYLDHWQPANQVETDLVHDMVSARWRFTRFAGWESAVIDVETILSVDRVDALLINPTDDHRNALSARFIADKSSALSTFLRHETRHRRTFRDAVADLRRIQAERRSQEPTCTPETEKRQIEPGVVEIDSHHPLTVMPLTPGGQESTPPDLPDAA